MGHKKHTFEQTNSTGMEAKRMMMPEKFDIRSVDRSKLRNLDQVKIDTSLPCEQRVKILLSRLGIHTAIWMEMWLSVWDFLIRGLA